MIALSARSAAGLADLARTVGEALSHPASVAGNAADIARNLILDRRLYPWRCAAAASDPAALVAALASAAQAAPAPADSPPRVAFLFTGQGSQWPGMARRLHAREPVFRAAFDECAALLRPHVETSLAELVWPAGADGRARLDQTGNAQPALFAVEYALAVLWRHWGVRPDVMVGHSIGEYAAACLAGVMDLADAAALVAARGRLMQSLPAGGGMMALAMPKAEAATWLSRHPALELAAVNAATTVAIAGPLDALEALAAELPAGVGTRLRVSHAFHSRAMEPILDQFGEVAARVRLRPPRHTIISTVTGAPAGDELADPAYWVRQLRQPVRFAAAAAALGDIDAAVEIGPRPVLLSLLPQGGVRRLPSLRDGDAGDVTILHSLVDLFAAGAEIDWAAFHADRPGRRAPALRHPRSRTLLDRAAAKARARSPNSGSGFRSGPRATGPSGRHNGRSARPRRRGDATASAVDPGRYRLCRARRRLADPDAGRDRHRAALRRHRAAPRIVRVARHADQALRACRRCDASRGAGTANAPANSGRAGCSARRPSGAGPARRRREAGGVRGYVAALAERLRTKTPGSWQSRAATGPGRRAFVQVVGREPADFQKRRPRIQELFHAVADKELATLFALGAGIRPAAQLDLVQVLFEILGQGPMMLRVFLELG